MKTTLARSLKIFLPVRASPCTQANLWQCQSPLRRALSQRVTLPRCYTTPSERLGHRDNYFIPGLDPKTSTKEDRDHLYQVSLALSQTPTEGNTQVQCLFYDSHGVSTGTRKMTKQSIADEYQLSTRDLRTIDLPSAGFPHILIRDRAILLHLFDLRMVIQANGVVLFDVDEDVGREHFDNTSRVFNHNLEDKMLHKNKLDPSAALPYELRVLEIALISVTSTLEAQYLLVKKSVKEALATLNEDSIIQFELRTLLELVRTLSVIEQRARQIRDTVQGVLNDDRDMADMYLTDRLAGKRHNIEDHQSVEYLLEAIQKSSDAVVQQTGGLLNEIKRTEETIQSILNVRRNQIMILEAKIEIFMVGLASATLVAGLYGMNVVNYFEESQLAFGVLTGSCLIATFAIWALGMRRLHKISKFHPRYQNKSKK